MKVKFFLAHSENKDINNLLKGTSFKETFEFS